MRPSRLHSLEYKLPVFFSGILAVVIFGLALLAMREVRLLAEQRAEARLISVSQQFAQASAEGTLRRTAALAVAANRAELIQALRDPSPAAMVRARAALALLPSDSTVLGLRLRDANDRSVLMTGDTAALMRLSPPPLLRDSVSGVSQFMRIGDTIAFATSTRISSAGRMLGRLVQWRRVVLTPQIRESFRAFIGSEAELYFGNQAGDLWYGLAGTVVDGPPDSVTPGVVTRWHRPGQGEQLLIVRPLSNTPWTMAAEIPISFVMSQPRAFLRRFAVISALLLILGALVSLMMSRRLTTPLRRLTEATEAIAAGDYSRAIGDDGDDEIGRLARAFRVMSLRVQDTQRQLEADIADRRQEMRDTQEKLQAAVGAIPKDRRLPGDRD